MNKYKTVADLKGEIVKAVLSNINAYQLKLWKICEFMPPKYGFS